ncbi:GSK3-beta interaction protein-like [Sycon ciliatum]|uniref:GSK3-beta interaction protein-like n=1 Tax=Sycon ciliatum TaxID=27933 RepID=UPI0031F61E04
MTDTDKQGSGTCPCDSPAEDSGPVDAAAFLLEQAEDVGKDIGSCVNAVRLSATLEASAEAVYLNIETKEKSRYCIEVCPSGFRVVGYDYDTTSVTDEPYCETIYMLLDAVSPMYRFSFASSLASKLAQLSDSAVEENADEPSKLAQVGQCS